MQTKTLDEAELAYLDHHRSLNHSEQTIEHHRWTFVDYRRFLTETNRPADLSSLNTTAFRAFHAWLVATPIKKPFRGTTVRSERGIKGRLTDLRAFVRWLTAEEWLEKTPIVPIPKVAQTLFPILSDADLVILFSCPHLTAKGERGIRNRAILSLLLDSAIRRGELVSLQLQGLMLTDGLIRVTGKGSKTRLVPVSTSVAQAMGLRAGAGYPLGG